MHFMLNQPFNGQLGDILINRMSDQYSKLTILSAFAKNSGVLRLKPALEAFRERGGQIEAFIGLDAYGTSYEAVLNLFHICDSLYIVHSESPVTTFHSKIYVLQNGTDNMWMAIGSNNLTGGGLWTNFESASYFDVDDIHATYRDNFNTLVNQYKQEDYECSMQITSEEQLHELLEADYIRREIRIHLDTRAAHQTRRTQEQEQTQPLFGTHTGIPIPRLQQPTLHRAPRRQTPNTTPTTRGGNTETAQGIYTIEETNNTERIWFETRSMTGGSRNILDLSKLGSVVAGDGSNTRYETNNLVMILGGVAFFDIDPENTNVEKDITVNYEGVDYAPCTIKFAPNNGSWRIQLKGENTGGDLKIHTANGVNWLQHKILIFEKIRTDYYVMSVTEPYQMGNLIAQSYVVASNGSSPNSKQYGLLR